MIRSNRRQALSLQDHPVVLATVSTADFDRYLVQDDSTPPPGLSAVAATDPSPIGTDLPAAATPADAAAVASAPIPHSDAEPLPAAADPIATALGAAPVGDIVVTYPAPTPDPVAVAPIAAAPEADVVPPHDPAPAEPILVQADEDTMPLPERAPVDSDLAGPSASDARARGTISAGPVSPTLAQEVTWINALNPNGTISATSYWGTNGGVANKWGPNVAGTGATISYFFDTASAFTANEQATYLKAFAMWESVANVHFVAAANSSSVGVLLVRGSDGGAYEYGGYYTSPGQIATHNNPNTGEPVQATISIDTSQGGFDLSGSFDVVGGYGLSTVIHEVGHLLGLGHGGTYNGNVDASTQQYSAYDERMYSTMSYIFYGTPNPKYAGSYPVTGTNWGVTTDGYLRQAPHTVQMLDILAIQQLYGVSQNTPLVSGTVYGFNTSITGPLKGFFDFTVNTSPVVTLYNQGVGNTLDLSGYAVAQTINLNAGAFSSVAGLTNNLAIAQGTRIDSLVGGSGNDLIVANSNGDTIDGGAGVDTVSFAAAAAAVTVSLVAAGAQASGGAGSVMLSRVENLTGSAFNDTLTGDANANVLDGGAGNDTLDGGGGIDTASYASATAGVTVSLSIAGAQNTVGAGTDTLISIENLTGSAFDDILSGNAGDNVLTGGGGFDTASYANATAGVTVSLAIAGAQNTVGAGTDTLVGISALVGSTFADTLTGSNGADTLDGGGGADTLIGGAGDDTYIVNNAGVTITEAANGGTDTVRTSLSNYVLPANVERLVYTGSAAQTFTGGLGVDNVTGGSGNDYFNFSQGGDDIANGGAGNDSFFFGAAFTAADRVDGGSGTNDQIGLQGDYTGGNALTLGANTVTGVEVIAALPGFSYNITSIDANLAAGQNLTIYGSGLGSGDNLTFNGSAETDGYFTVYGGMGADNITTGAGNDGIYFGAGRFSVATDHVDGGAGTNDQMALDGVYTNLTIARANVVNVEVLVLLDGQAATPANYAITLADDWTTAGEAHTVYAVGVRNGVSVDGHLETDSALKFYGGRGADTLVGGADTTGGTNWFDGGLGGDTMTGGAGVDTYFYNTAANSMGVNHDTIVNFDVSVDKIDLPFTVTDIDAAQMGTLSTNSFDDDLTAALSTLGANHAVQFTVNDGGALNGHVFEVIDVNGVAGYQAGQDMVIELVNLINGPIGTTAPFI